MKVILSVLFLVVTSLAIVTAFPVNIREIHPQCAFTDCINASYVEQLDTNIYRTLIYPTVMVRYQVPTCKRQETAMLSCPALSGYFLDNEIARPRPLQICTKVNNPKPAECVNDDSSESDEEEPSFPCCDFILFGQANLEDKFSANPPPPPEGSGIIILPFSKPGYGYALVFDDSAEDDNVYEKWNYLKEFLASQGRLFATTFFNFADFSFPGAPDTNRYWILVQADD